MAARNAPEEDDGDLARQMKTIQADVAALTETIKHFAVAQAGHVAEAVGVAGERVKTTAAEARRRGEVAAEEVEQLISRNPFTAILVAMGLGYIVGFISRR